MVLCIVNNMGEYHYKRPRPAIIVDMVLFSVHQDQLRVLFIKLKSEPFKNMWALPGGFVEFHESLEEAAR